MSKSTDYFAETTGVRSFKDGLSEALRSLRISGSLLLREHYAPPWGIAIPNAKRLGTLLRAETGTRVVAFHLVEFGHSEIKLENGEHAVITAGEMAICFAGVAHRLSQGRKPNVLPVERLLAGEVSPSATATTQTRGASLLCGVFQLHDTFLNPLFAALPPLLRTSVSRNSEFHNLSGVARLMAQEIDNKHLGSRYVVERLLEVLCAEAIRAYIETTPQAGWFGAIKDPVIGRAIAAIHAHPGEDWSVQRLAQGVTLSPSRFAARFTATLGESPMAYVAKWRMSVACRLLASTQQAIDQIATEVGYDNSAAFNRAFKKHVGMLPATWRAHERS